MRHRHIATGSSLLLIVAILILACSAPAAPSASTPSASTPSAATPAPEALECEAAAYPCSLADVAPAVLERSDALGDQVATLLRKGGTMADAEALLAGQDGMAEVESDEIVVRFRLDGGRGVWIMTAGAFAPGSRSSGSPAPAAIADPLSLVASYAIVGDDTEAKAAVVLSPFLWYFGASDDGADVAALLETTRGYAGNVTYRANATEADVDVGIDSFKGWRKDQVVHVSSHGARLCKRLPCRAIIVAGILTGSPEAIDEPGVEIVKTATGTERGLELEGGATGRTFVALAADFFRNQYPGGLDQAFVFFNACSTYGPAATDLGDAIRGHSSVYLGWTEAVDSVAARDAATALYTSLGRDGFTVDAAYDALRALQVDPDPDGKQARLSVAGPSRGDDLRIRQVVAFRTTGGWILSATDRVPIKGVGGDGQPDSVPYEVTVDGVAAETGTLATVRVSIDGQAAAPVNLSSGTEIEPGRWSISGEIDLGYDLLAEKVVDFKASADLPEGGTSTHATQATIAGTPIMGLTWSGWATDVGDANGDGSVKVRSRAELTFGYEPGQKAGATYAWYELTAGTITWRIDGTSSDGCRFLSPEMTVKITTDLDSDSHLVFDLTKSPVEYAASAGIQGGPLVDVIVTCPDKISTYTTRVGFNSMVVGASDHLTVSGNLISGSYRLGVGQYEWELRRQD